MGVPRQDWSRRLRQLRCDDNTIQILYADDSAFVTLSVVGLGENALTDLAHGTRSFCVLPATPNALTHPLAVAGVSPGFLSAAHATNLATYSGHAVPTGSQLGQSNVGGRRGPRWEEPAVDQGRATGPRLAARRIDRIFVDVDNWVASDEEFIEANGGSGSNIYLPDRVTAVSGVVYSVFITNIGAFNLPVNPGEYLVGTPASIAGSPGPIDIPAGECWRLVGPDLNGDWKRFISA